MVSAYRQLSFWYCRALQGTALYAFVAEWSKDPLNQPSDGLRACLETLPTPNDFSDCSNRFFHFGNWTEETVHSPCLDRPNIRNFWESTSGPSHWKKSF